MSWPGCDRHRMSLSSALWFAGEKKEPVVALKEEKKEKKEKKNRMLDGLVGLSEKAFRRRVMYVSWGINNNFNQICISS